MSGSPTRDAGLPTEPGVGSMGETAHDPPAAIDRSWLANRSRLLIAIVAIVAVEAALVVVNIAFGQREGFPGRLSLTRHLGVPEVLEYLQWLLAAALMWSLRRHGAVYVVWALVLLFRFAGDSLEFHRFLERLLNPGALLLVEPFGATPAIKEVLGHVVEESTLMILALLALVAIGPRRADPIARSYTRRAIALQVIYVGFLVLGEWLFLFVIDDRRVAGILEEGGEMAATTLIFGLALLHAGERSSRREGPSTVGRSRRA